MKLQEIISRELSARGGGLVMLETGTIRGSGENYERGDGWSTVAFARHVREAGGTFMSIDLDTAVSHDVLTREGLREFVDLRQGHSLEVLPDVVGEGHRFDVVLLDSDNDPDLIMNEFLEIRAAMKPGAVLLVDDVEPQSMGVVKGHKILPILRGEGYEPEIIAREGDGFTTGVMRAVL